jgi:drug/metabolite transporter (DMT)-like permease
VRLRDSTDMLLLGAIWGGAFPLLRIASPVFGPVALITVRLVIAAVAMLLILRSLAALRRNAGRLMWLGILNSAVPFTLYSYALLSISAGLGSLLNATVPIFGALLSYFWLGERPALSRVLGIVIAVGGITAIVWDSIAARGEAAALGVGAGLLGAALYALAAIYAKRQLASLDNQTVAAGSLCGAALVMLPAGAYAWPARTPTLGAWIAAAALGVVCSALAYLIYFRLLRNVGAARAVTVSFLIPVFGIFWGAVFLHEPVTLGLLANCAVVLAGTALASGVVELGRRTAVT